MSGAAMPLLFSYGTLQDADVQLSAFGRHLVGQRDELVGFASSTVEITNADVAAALGRTHHANVVLDGNATSRVSGTVFEVTDGELARADLFESAYDYKRIAVTLGSGTRAWVYVCEPHGV
jgi:gamma-glutamylcyclotransferase (GGCT)/AIG2-like uncharacterized protein YtfP